MKNKLYYFVLITCFFLSYYSNTAKAQDIQLDGKSYQTANKQSLATGVEFVTLKSQGVSSPGISCLKVDNDYSKTVFTLAQLQLFFSSGRLSSFGKVKQAKIAAAMIHYIDNGSSIVIIKYNNQKIGFIEINDNKTILLIRNYFVIASNDNDPGGSTGDPLLDCGADCLDKYIGCGNAASCHSAYTKCWNECKGKNPSQSGSGGSISHYILPLNKLAVKL